MMLNVSSEGPIRCPIFLLLFISTKLGYTVNLLILKSIKKIYRNDKKEIYWLYTEHKYPIYLNCKLDT